MSKSKSGSNFVYILLSILIVAILGGGGFIVFRDTTPPVITLSPEDGPLGESTKMTLNVSDAGSGLQNLEIRWDQGEKGGTLLVRDFANMPPNFSAEISLPENGVKDGEVRITVKAKDGSIYPFGPAGKSMSSYTYALDTKAPRTSLSSAIHNLNQGGTGIVLFNLNEEVEKAGVQVGDRFFPAYKLQCRLPEDGQYACLFAIPWDTPPSQFQPLIVAVDKAGNESKRGFPFHANARNFRKDRIGLSDGFMQAKMPEFAAHFSEGMSYQEQFLLVNRQMRKENRAKLIEIGRDTAPCPLWKGTFKRLPNSANRARFADNRDYIYKGQKIDNQTHLGIDLASLANDPVPAANSGTVVFADYLGIYGNVVILDHGLGLQSLYAHLSQIDVAVGDTLERGTILGKTGLTGMAGGDHLHYGVLVSGIPVQPIEWWDATWIENNITSKLSLN